MEIIELSTQLQPNLQKSAMETNMDLSLDGSLVQDNESTQTKFEENHDENNELSVNSLRSTQIEMENETCNMQKTASGINITYLDDQADSNFMQVNIEDKTPNLEEIVLSANSMQVNIEDNALHLTNFVSLANSIQMNSEDKKYCLEEIGNETHSSTGIVLPSNSTQLNIEDNTNNLEEIVSPDNLTQVNIESKTDYFEKNVLDANSMPVNFENKICNTENIISDTISCQEPANTTTEEPITVSTSYIVSDELCNHSNNIIAEVTSDKVNDGTWRTRKESSSSTDTSSDEDTMGTNVKKNTVHDLIDEEEEKLVAYKPKTKGELSIDDLPPVEYLSITAEDTVKLVLMGDVSSIVDKLVVIQSVENAPPLDMDSYLFFKDRRVLGQIFETFGRVKAPFYTVRFNTVDDIKEQGVTVGTSVYYAPAENNFSQYVLTKDLLAVKGSDASWMDNNEPPEGYVEFSDDEQERMVKKKKKAMKLAGKSNDCEIIEVDGDITDTNNQSRKRPRVSTKNRSSKTSEANNNNWFSRCHNHDSEMSVSVPSSNDRPRLLSGYNSDSFTNDRHQASTCGLHQQRFTSFRSGYQSSSTISENRMASLERPGIPLFNPSLPPPRFTQPPPANIPRAFMQPPPSPNIQVNQSLYSPSIRPPISQLLSQGNQHLMPSQRHAYPPLSSPVNQCSSFMRPPSHLLPPNLSPGNQVFIPPPGHILSPPSFIVPPPSQSPRGQPFIQGLLSPTFTNTTNQNSNCPFMPPQGASISRCPSLNQSGFNNNGSFGFTNQISQPIWNSPPSFGQNGQSFNSYNQRPNVPQYSNLSVNSSQNQYSPNPFLFPPDTGPRFTGPPKWI